MKNTSLTHFYLTIFLLTGFVLLFNGCKKEDVEVYPEVKDPMMTINFTDDYINPQLGAIIFASDSMGNVIADTLIQGNGKIYLYPKPGIKIPSHFMITIAKWEPSMHNFEISLNSYMVNALSDWMLQGHRPDTLGHFTINLVNAAPSALILYANAGYSNLTTMVGNVQNLSYVDPDDLFIKTDDGQSQKSMLISDIHPGKTYNIDMAQAQAPTFGMIGISGVYYEARVWGYKNSDFENSQPIMTDYALGDIPGSNLIHVAILSALFQGYRTELKLIESWDSLATFTCRVSGEIPAAFQKIDARIQSLIDFGSGKIKVQAAGDFTTTNATWKFYGHNNQVFTWTMSGSDTATHFKLPMLSASMLHTFPTLSLDSLNFYNVELTKYPEVGSYNDHLQLIFDPVHPRSENTLNASSLIFGSSR